MFPKPRNELLCALAREPDRHEAVLLQTYLDPRHRRLREAPLQQKQAHALPGLIQELRLHKNARAALRVHLEHWQVVWPHDAETLAVVQARWALKELICFEELFRRVEPAELLERLGKISRIRGGLRTVTINPIFSHANEVKGSIVLSLQPHAIHQRQQGAGGLVRRAGRAAAERHAIPSQATVGRKLRHCADLY